jgi:carboxyl-terminal processing protease
MGSSMIAQIFKPVLSLAFALSSLAFASPAQDLFNQATYYLAVQYNGYSSADYANFNAKYQPALDTACADLAEACPFSAAVPVIQQMLEELKDGHTYLLTKEANLEAQRQRAGLGPSTPKIGMVTTKVKDSFDRLVTDLWEGAPASRVGLLRGDLVVSLNGKLSSEFGDTFAISIAKAISNAETVILGVSRAGKAFEFKLKGELLTVRLPFLKVLPGRLGLMRIPNFDVSGQVASKVHELVAQANTQKLRGLILDLRDNPGGIVTELMGVSAAFLPKTSLTFAARDGSSTYSAENGAVNVSIGLLQNVPLQNIAKPSFWKGSLEVLVNSRSGSAAEYLPQFLQDAKRAVVIGENTAGVGNTGISAFGLPDGSALYISIIRALRADSSPFPDHVTPDVPMTDDLELLAASGRDVVLEKALELMAK